MTDNIGPISGPAAPGVPCGAHRVGRRARRFLRDEAGGMVGWTLLTMLITLTVGGFAVSLIRVDTERTRTQAVADASVIAAASMSQELDPQLVVESYFAAAGLTSRLKSTQVTDGINGRRVRADVALEVPTFMPRLVGSDMMSAGGVAQAEEWRANVEISLVLDISGSMLNVPSRIENLRNAANEFVTEILDADTESRTSISMIPYNGQVNLGPLLINKYNVDNPHSPAQLTYCMELPSTVYTTLAFPRTTARERTVLADNWGYTGPGVTPATLEGAPRQTNCPRANRPTHIDRGLLLPAESRSRVVAFSGDSADLGARVLALEGEGATSIDLGLRWGVTMLDPSFRPVLNELISEGHAPAAFAGRPVDYGTQDTLKVLVLMTDGEHFTFARISPTYRSGQAPIWRSVDGNGVSRYTIHHPSGNGSNSAKYWVPHRSEWRSGPFNAGTTPVRLNWPDVWAERQVTWVAFQLYDRAGRGSWTWWRDQFRSQTQPFEMDERLLSLCTLAKQQGVLIFGIAFEADPGGIAVLSQCSSPNRFYDVNGLEIRDAFRSIRSQIQLLRLTL